MQAGDEAVWKALSDPVRRTILDLLRTGPATTSALAARFDQTRFGVMKHLKVLQAGGLIIAERRGRERWNYLNAPTLQQALDRWLNPFQAAWAQRLTALARHHQASHHQERSQAMGCELDIRSEILLPAPPAAVFHALTTDIAAWWQAPYRQAGADSRLTLEPAIGAPLLETGPDGHAAIWGRIEEIRCPDRLYMSGRFAVAGAVAGQVQIDLTAEPNGCRLTLAHRAVGAITEATCASFRSGWHELLSVRLRRHLEATG